MKLKKLLSLILTTLVLFALVGCGNNSTVQENNLEEEPKQEFYRSIQVDEIDGEVIVVHNDGNKLQAYEGMSLVDGDTVEVGESASLLLKVDSDKNLLAEANTVFTLDAKGTEESNQTQILLQSGSVLCEIQEKLKDDESFEVVTGSSTMSVRGTVFKSQILQTADGIKYDAVEVFEGKVWSKLDSSENDFDVEVEPGSFVIAKQQTDNSASGYVSSDLITDDFFTNPIDIETTDDLTSVTSEINYDNLTELERIKLTDISNSGRKLSYEVTNVEVVDGKTIETKKITSSSDNGDKVSVDIKTEIDEEGNKKINIGVIEYDHSGDNDESSESSGPAPTLGDGGVDRDPKEGIEVSDEPFTPSDDDDPDTIHIPIGRGGSGGDENAGGGSSNEVPNDNSSNGSTE